MVMAHALAFRAATKGVATKGDAHLEAKLRFQVPEGEAQDEPGAGTGCTAKAPVLIS